MSLRKLGRYDIVRVLGKGAMGIVYEGRDPNLDRRVAIKTVKVENLSAEAAAEYEARFRTEARSAGRLQHPNIVSVYDSDRHGDIAYLVMEYIQGDDLKQHLDQGERYTLEESVRLVRDLLAALEYAHKQGIVHRDIKPANLLIEPGGRLKLTDFGVARMEDSTDATRTQGAMVGTLKYMSPEQVQGQKIDSRADLFSVGVLLYQLLTDKRPFDGENEFAIIQQIVAQNPAPPSSVNARLPAAIDAVLAHALAKDRQQRYATAGEFSAALQAAVRLAEDATVVPPADPARYARILAGAGQLLTSPGTSPMGSSTVTQELELVYWKDVKDSAEAEELEVFLAKFPDGVYADLARRRLRKLAVASSTPDQTILSGMEAAAKLAAAPLPSGLAGLEPEYTATVAEPRPDEAGPAEGAVATAAVASGTPAILELTEVPVRSPAIAVEPIAAPDESVSVLDPSTIPLSPATPTQGAAPAAGQAPQRSSMPLFAGAGALALAGLAALLMWSRSGTEPAVAPALGAASAPRAVASAPAARALVPASATVPVAAAASHAARSSAAASPSNRGASGGAKKLVVKAVPTVAALPASEPARAANERPAPAPVRDEARNVTATAPRPPTSGVETCREKSFLSREFCLAEECDKPGARSHPLCVQRRADAKLREESRMRN